LNQWGKLENLKKEIGRMSCLFLVSVKCGGNDKVK
jgi:hypothetical protein